jgi:hypothetical protein
MIRPEVLQMATIIAIGSALCRWIAPTAVAN